jgi:two-component system nitrogen regulation sensor histidine kinase NtrY
LTTAGKIRALLALLFASLLITAIIVEKTYSPANNLAQTAQALEDNLHQKERYVYNMLNDKETFNQLKGFSVKHKEGLAFINDYTLNKSIWLITLRNGQISFWSGAKIIPNNAARFKDACCQLLTGD